MTETVLAFDFGGTWLKVAEVDREGTILWDERTSPKRDFAQDMNLVREMIERRTENVVAGAVASPGPLDFHTGQVLKAANLNWLDVSPGQELSSYLNVPVAVENDADCAALAESVYGSGRDALLLVFYGIGTGVGSGVIANAEIFHGAFDPEFGHQILEPKSDRYCTAGHRGCLESLISGRSLESAFGGVENVPDEQWESVIPHYLGQALANATVFLSPDVIALGGGVIDHRPDIVPPAISEMEEMLHDFVVPPRVVTSSFGREVGILGAAAAAWKLYDDLQLSQV